MITVAFIVYHKPTVQMCLNIANKLNKNYKSIFIAYESLAQKELKKRDILYYSKDRKVKEILNEIQPNIVITPHNINPIGYLFVRNARRKGIPTLLMHEGGSEQSQFLSKKIATNTGLILLPLSIMDIISLAIFRFKKIYFGSQYVAHSGSDVVAVASEKSASFLKSLGISSKIVVTGQPRFDDIVNNRYNLGEIRKKYNLDSRRVILVLTTIVVVDGIWQPSKLKRFILEMINISNETDSQLVIKIHPRESIEFYREIDKDITVTKDDLYGLMHIADVVVSIPSTTTLEALMLGKSVIIPDFLTRKSYAHELGLTGAKSYNDIKKMIKNPPCMSINIEKFVYKMDGKSSERVAELIGDMI